MSKRRPHVPGTKARALPPHKRICVVVGDEGDPVVGVQYHDHRAHPRDSGYMVFTASAPKTPADATEDDYGTWCLHCLNERHPEVERGLILARAYGFAYWDEDGGEWIAEDDDGNEVVFDSGDDLPAGAEER